MQSQIRKIIKCFTVHPENTRKYNFSYFFFTEIIADTIAHFRSNFLAIIEPSDASWTMFVNICNPFSGKAGLSNWPQLGFGCGVGLIHSSPHWSVSGTLFLLMG